MNRVRIHSLRPDCSFLYCDCMDDKVEVGNNIEGVRGCLNISTFETACNLFIKIGMYNQSSHALITGGQTNANVGFSVFDLITAVYAMQN